MAKKEGLQFVSFNIYILSMFGVWPLDHKETFFGNLKKWTKTTIFYLHMTIFFSGQAYKFYSEITDITTVSDV